MTDRYDERTREVPSRASILVGILAAWSALIVTGYIGIGMESGREYAGFFLGIVVSLLMIGSTISRIMDRAYSPPDRMAAEDDGEEVRDELVDEPVADQFGPYEPFEPFEPAWNQATSVYNRPPRLPLRVYSSAECSSAGTARHAAWLAPPTEVIQRGEGVTEVIELPQRTD